MSYLNRIRKLPSIQRLAYWINERQLILMQRADGMPAPWTADPILQLARFCNVHREDDRVTLWIKHNWRDPHLYDEHMWHAMIIARTINWPATLAVGGWPEPWSRKRRSFGKRVLAYKAQGNKVFTGAYIVSTNGVNADKMEYVLNLFDQSWTCDEPPVPGDTLARAHAKLMEIKGLGSFMAGQVVADLKNTPYLASASDWNDWCAPGPGSMRGLARLQFPLGHCDIIDWSTYRIDRNNFVPNLLNVRKQLTKYTKVQMCLQDMQNVLCEFDKYERILWGQGRARTIYKTHGTESCIPS